MTIAAIDFSRLYRDHVAASQRPHKTPRDWDDRVRRVERKLAHADYVTAFLNRMDLSECSSVLDVGCGAGALALPLAAQGKEVVALDFSPKMLDALRESAAAEKLHDIDVRLCAWEDDWSGVPACDVAVASRSIHLGDLGSALIKLDSKARRRVYLTFRISDRMLDTQLLAVLDRHEVAPPDYIYALNILHSMGIDPKVDHIEGGPRAEVKDFDALLQRATWSLGSLEKEETKLLRSWFEHRLAHGPILMPARRWAFISWEK